MRPQALEDGDQILAIVAGRNDGDDLLGGIARLPTDCERYPAGGRRFDRDPGRQAGGVEMGSYRRSVGRRRCDSIRFGRPRR